MRLATQRMFVEPGREWQTPGEATFDAAQLLLLGIERALAPPIVHMRTNFQPMRVVIVEPDQILPDEDSAFNLPRALPQAAMMSPHARSQFHQRVIHGEVLIDDDGRLYERLGRRIRPIHQLASSANGELIELVSIVNPNLRLIEAPPTPKVVDAHDTAPAPASVEKKNPFAPELFIPVQQSEETKDIGYRKLFADPGQWRVVWWADFKEVLAKQLAHPDRLKDTYRLPCYVQVIEVERPMTIEKLAERFVDEDSAHKSLFFLDNEIASKLELTPLLPPVPLQNAKRPPNTLLRHDRLFRLLVANDPTVDVADGKDKQNSYSTVTNKPPLKSEIPNRFTLGDFAITREEALYDLNADKSLIAKFIGFIRKIRMLKRRAQMRKWQVMLAGKNLEEQLWNVHPPRDRLTDVAIRNWARHTLAAAGYDQDLMINEWEIFWRRKGLV